MPVPRNQLIDRTESGYYHCISRCVRQAFLCGDEFDYRRAWIEERARWLASIFAIDVCKFGILNNHFHLILRNEPDLVEEWSDDEVVERWKSVHPGSALLRGKPDQEGDATMRVAEMRERLRDISWFMRALKQYVGARANLEDGAKGQFWSERFKSIRILDEAALLACSIYIDLNAVRAKIADTPEESKYSSVHNRILVKHLHECRRGERPKAPQDAEQLIGFENECTARLPDRTKRTKRKKKRRGRQRAALPFRADEAGIWMTPIENDPPGAPKRKTAAARRRRGLFNMTIGAYLALVDEFGRIVKAGKGFIADCYKPILERLRIDPDRLATFLQGKKQLYGTIAGAVAERRKRTRAVTILDISLDEH